MIKKVEKITPFQLFSITLFSMAFGLNLYPSAINHEITHEWLIAQIITLTLLIPVLFMLFRIFKDTETDSFKNSLNLLIGKFPSRIAGTFFFVYFLLQALQIVSLESNDIQLFLFDKTPQSVIAAVFVISSLIISVSKISSLARLSELLSVPVLLTVVIMLILFLSSGNFVEIKTMLKPELKAVLPQAIRSVSCVACIETALFFICRTENQKHSRNAVLCGFLICAAIAVILTVCIVSTFTLKAGTSLIYPVTELARTVQLKYLRIIERFDTIALMIKIISTCLFTSIVCFCSAEALSMVFRPMKFRYQIPVYGLLLLTSLLAPNDNIDMFISYFLLYAEIFILFIFIPILFVIAEIKKRGGKEWAGKDFS